METLAIRKIMSLLDGDESFHTVKNHDIRADKGALVRDYPDLVEKVAKLSFYNPEHVLLFRGQRRDWCNLRGNSSIKASIFRSTEDRKLPSPSLLAHRYEILGKAERRLAESFAQSRFIGRNRIARHRILRWAILQHYEVCATPLLDVTQSLRVAASFALNDVGCDDSPILYVFSVPFLSGSITASSEQGIQIIRLSSICPPEARRPYFQEGYLLAEYPDWASFNKKQDYHSYEIDFGRRLLAKFRLKKNDFWSKDYATIPNEALYPNERDPLTEYLVGAGLARIQNSILL